MIVITSAFVLNPVETGPDHPLIGWQNLVTASGVSTDTALANYPAVNLANPATHLEWRAADTTEQHITIVTDGLSLIDYVAVARHNFGSGKIPVSIEGFIAGVWTEIESAVLLPPDDAPVLWRFQPQALPQLRIRLQTGIAAGRAAVVYAGKLLIMERRLWVGHTPLPHGRKSTVTNGMSESGQFLGRIVLGAWRETVAPFQLISPAWYRANMDAFLAVAQQAPFFFAWRPASYPLEVGYAWLIPDDPMPMPDDDSNGNLLAFNLTMRGVI
jgi:hypothetical protein